MGNEDPTVTRTNCDQFHTIVFTRSSIKEKINNLKPASAPGNDEIRVKQIQLLSEILFEPLEIKYNK